MSSTSGSNTNLAQLYGYHSVIVPIVFAVVYVSLTAWFIGQFIVLKTKLIIYLILFGIFRAVGFGLRAYLTGNNSTSQTPFTVDQVLFKGMVFHLLLSTFDLIIDLEKLPHARPTSDNIFRNGKIYKLVVMGGVILNVIAAQKLTKDQNDSTGKAMQIGGSLAWLLGAVWVGAIAMNYHIAQSSANTKLNKFGAVHAGLIFCVVSAMFIVREGFSLATTHNLKAQQKEILFYPFLAGTELIAVILYSCPGLIPSRKQLKEAKHSSMEPLHEQAGSQWNPPPYPNQFYPAHYAHNKPYEA